MRTASERILNIFNADPAGTLTTQLVDKILTKAGVNQSRSAIRRGFKRLHLEGRIELEQGPRDRYGRKRWKLATGKVSSVSAAVTTIHSKGSGGRNSIMCMDPNRPKFNAGVEAVVLELVAAQQKFSAYDVTQKLREKVNDGTIVIDDPNQLTITVGGKTTANVLHQEVKDAVHDLYHQGKLTGYGRLHSGSYWEYMPQSMLPVVPSSDPSSDPVASSDPASTTPAADGTSYDGSPTL